MCPKYMQGNKHVPGQNRVKCEAIEVSIREVAQIMPFLEQYCNMLISNVTQQITNITAKAAVTSEAVESVTIRLFVIRTSAKLSPMLPTVSRAVSSS
ncbi:hypothetical protein TELCIR_12266 [Teladorsagia circumcincta]|uniref:Uncharacterized protein n=1 Tax=Teladorsagia circumcincta TaxID=45464 RepID=A0A2G9U710_TELCI|nr:hypothetical protein TELCIR_12266 [Teladorsagia circumcincta]